MKKLLKSMVDVPSKSSVFNVPEIKNLFSVVSVIIIMYFLGQGYQVSLKHSCLDADVFCKMVRKFKIY